MRPETTFQSHRAYTNENTIPRATRDASIDEICNEMREQIEKKDETKSANRGDQKPDFENQDKQRQSTANQQRGRQHQRQLNSNQPNEMYFLTLAKI